MRTRYRYLFGCQQTISQKQSADTSPDTKHNITRGTNLLFPTMTAVRRPRRAPAKDNIPALSQPLDRKK
jgi:hypothetical protein